MRLRGWGLIAVLFPALLMAVSACHSFHIETAVENRTGAEVRLLEVDYPSASFGADSLAPGASLHYRIQVRGEGPIKVQYTAGDGSQQQLTGPAIAEGQEGRLEIILLPAGKAQFQPELIPKH